VDQAGLPGFYMSVWNALWVPKGTPKKVIAQLNAAAMDAMADPTVRQRLSDLGLDIPSLDQQTPEALGAFHKAEVEKWWPIIKAANIKGGMNPCTDAQLVAAFLGDVQAVIADLVPEGGRRGLRGGRACDRS